MPSSKGCKSQNKPKSKAKAKTKTKSIPPDSPKWVVVQLSPMGEKEKNLEMIKKSARQILKSDIEMFIPAISQKVRNESQTVFFMDGYVFIRHVDGHPYHRLNETTYFLSVLSKISSDKKRVYSLLDDKALNPMRSGVQNMRMNKFVEDESVKVIKGNFRNLIGKIISVSDGGENVQVSIDLRSKKMIIDFPASYLMRA